MSNLTSMVLRGNIGFLQSLTLYYETFRAWAASGTEPKSDKAYEPVTAWVSQVLVDTFTLYGTAYPEVAKILSLDGQRVREAEKSRQQKLRVVTPSEFVTNLASIGRLIRKSNGADNASNWFDAGKWPPLSRPFFARNKLRVGGSDFEIRGGRSRPGHSGA